MVIPPEAPATSPPDHTAKAAIMVRHALRPSRREMLAERLKSILVAVVDPIQPRVDISAHKRILHMTALSLQLFGQTGTERPPRWVNCLPATGHILLRGVLIKLIEIKIEFN